MFKLPKIDNKGSDTGRNGQKNQQANQGNRYRNRDLPRSLNKMSHIIQGTNSSCGTYNRKQHKKTKDKVKGLSSSRNSVQ